jgi:hypothetical protein
MDRVCTAIKDGRLCNEIGFWLRNRQEDNDLTWPLNYLFVKKYEGGKVEYGRDADGHEVLSDEYVSVKISPACVIHFETNDENVRAPLGYMLDRPRDSINWEFFHDGDEMVYDSTARITVDESCVTMKKRYPQEPFGEKQQKILDLLESRCVSYSSDSARVLSDEALQLYKQLLGDV